MSEKEDLEMFVVGLVLDPATNAPIVILKDETGGICLPIWIGLAEATAIASALKKVEIVRPMTHDLLRTMIDELGARVIKVVINDLRDNTFYSLIEVVLGDALKTVDARPSDSIALAVRFGCPIFVSPIVLNAAQVNLVPSPGDSEGAEGEEALDDSPEIQAAETGGKNFASIEREKWAEILEEMDPDDFKYKM